MTLQEEHIIVLAAREAAKETARLIERKKKYESPWVTDVVAASLAARDLKAFHRDKEMLYQAGFPRPNPLFGNKYYKPSIMDFILRAENLSITAETSEAPINFNEF